MVLEAEGFEDEDILKPQELKAIGQLEKLSARKICGISCRLHYQTRRKPVLVPESDKRPALNSVENALNDFEGVE